jgi:hypothetical protein
MALIVAGATVTTGANLDATKLTGDLPEISGADLTGLPAPSTSNVGTATAGLTLGVVGSYSLIRVGGAGAPTTAGNNASGSLEYASAGGIIKSQYGTGAGTTPSGTWLMTGLAASGSNMNSTTICLRTS